MSSRIEITDARIIQIIPLTDCWIDEHNPALGLALVELTYTEHGPAVTASGLIGTELVPFGETLALEFPTDEQRDLSYYAGILGDSRRYVHFVPGHEEGEPFR